VLTRVSSSTARPEHTPGRLLVVAIAFGEPRGTVGAMTPLPVFMEGLHGSLSIDRPRPGAVCVVIAAHDVGEFGPAPFRVLDEQLAAGPYALFVDARQTQGASIEVSNHWARWLRANRDRLDRIHMLPGSRYVHVTADFVRRFAELEGSMVIYTDVAAFDEALANAA